MSDILAGILAILFLVVLSFGVTLVALVYGFGVTVHSWPVVVLCQVLQFAIVVAMQAVGNRSAK